MKATRLFFASALTWLVASVQAAETGCPSYAAFLPAPLQQHSQTLLGQLSVPLDQAPQTQVAAYLQHASNPSSSSEYVLRNYARVALAASHLHRQSYGQARQTLAQVELDSPAAVRAALMLAESYRLEGQFSVAGQWMLRIAERYSSNPDALSGLLLAADDAAYRGDIANALAVYSRVLEKTLGNIEEIRQLKSEPDSLYQVVEEGRIDNTRAVSSEVIQRTLSSAQSDSLAHYARLKSIAGELQCLVRREEALRESSFSSSLGNAKDSAFITMLENEKRLTLDDISDMESQLAAASPFDDTRDLSERLEQARGALTTIETRLSALQHSNEPQADGQRQQLASVQQRISALEAQQTESRDAINRNLSLVLDGLLTDYREMAGEAQLGRAQMTQLFSRVGLN